MVLLSGCVIGGGGYYGDGGIGVGYYEPYGVEYGGWGHGYQVAPFRGGDDHHRDGDYRSTGGGGQVPARAYKAAPASRPIPSIPSKRSTQSKPSIKPKPRSDDSRSR